MRDDPLEDEVDGDKALEGEAEGERPHDGAGDDADGRDAESIDVAHDAGQQVIAGPWPAAGGCSSS